MIIFLFGLFELGFFFVYFVLEEDLFRDGLLAFQVLNPKDNAGNSLKNFAAGIPRENTILKFTL